MKSNLFLNRSVYLLGNSLVIFALVIGLGACGSKKSGGQPPPSTPPAETKDDEKFGQTGGGNVPPTAKDGTPPVKDGTTTIKDVPPTSKDGEGKPDQPKPQPDKPAETKRTQNAFSCRIVPNQTSQDQISICTDIPKTEATVPHEAAYDADCGTHTDKTLGTTATWAKVGCPMNDQFRGTCINSQFAVARGHMYGGTVEEARKKCKAQDRLHNKFVAEF